MQAYLEPQLSNQVVVPVYKSHSSEPLCCRQGAGIRHKCDPAASPSEGDFAYM